MFLGSRNRRWRQQWFERNAEQISRTRGQLRFFSGARRIEWSVHRPIHDQCEDLPCRRIQKK